MKQNIPFIDKQQFSELAKEKQFPYDRPQTSRNSSQKQKKFSIIGISATSASGSSVGSRRNMSTPTAPTVNRQTSLGLSSSSSSPSQITMAQSLSSYHQSQKNIITISKPNKQIFTQRILEESIDCEKQYIGNQEEGIMMKIQESKNISKIKSFSPIDKQCDSQLYGNGKSILASVLNINNPEILQSKESLFFNPPPVAKFESLFIGDNKGDHQSSMHEESSLLQALMQSSMLESTKINERGKGSMFLQPKTFKLTKRLLDLKEPPNIQEEEEDDDEDKMIASLSDLMVFGIQKESEEIQKVQELEFESECEFLTNVEEFSPYQSPPSMSSINNEQMNRNWSNSKQPKQNTVPYSLNAKSIDSRNSLQKSNSIPIPSSENNNFHENKNDNENTQKEKEGTICTRHKSNDNIKPQNNKALFIIERQVKTVELNSKYKEEQDKNTSFLSESIPEEMEKKEILQTLKIANWITPAQQLNQNKREKCLNKNESYFNASLIKSFSSQKDRLSVLYLQYFHKTHSNYQIPFSLDSLYLQGPIINLPHLATPSRKTIFFDLDETLIHCIDIFTSHQQFQLFSQSSLAQRQLFSNNSESCNETFCTIKLSPQEKLQCLISIRPFARQVLLDLAEDFELILLTAGRQMYADAVLEKLDPDRRIFSQRFYRESCIEFSLPSQHSSSTKNYLKDLRIFQNRKIQNVILVDNSPLSFINNINNGVPILDYCNNNKQDKELLELQLFLKSLKNVPDVRPVIQKKFLLEKYKQISQSFQLQEFIIKEAKQPN